MNKLYLLTALLFINTVTAADASSDNEDDDVPSSQTTELASQDPEDELSDGGDENNNDNDGVPEKPKLVRCYARGLRRLSDENSSSVDVDSNFASQAQRLAHELYFSIFLQGIQDRSAALVSSPESKDNQD